MQTDGETQDPVEAPLLIRVSAVDDENENRFSSSLKGGPIFFYARHVHECLHFEIGAPPVQGASIWGAPAFRCLYLLTIARTLDASNAVMI